MAEIEVKMFGPPVIMRGGDQIQLPRRKSLALLCYLTIENGPHCRDELSTLFWPERGQTEARGNLRSALFAITDALGPSALLCGRETIGIVQERIISDVELFSRYARGCGLHPKTEPCADCIPNLAAAEEVYRGDFMAGFTLPDCREFDAWQLIRGEKYRDVLTDVLRRLIKAARGAGMGDAAIAAARRLLELDPLDEAAHRTIMREYLRVEDWSAVQRQYRECERALRAELNQTPEEKTRSLFEAAILRKKRTASEGNPHASVDFIGRKHELAEMRALLAKKEVRLITLSGPGGVGKTRLAQRAAAESTAAFSDGARFVDLTPAERPEAVAARIAAALDLEESRSGATSIETVLCAALASLELLLVLDNFEQVLSAAPLISRLLRRTSRLRILVTSREALGIPEEQVLEVPPMRFPKALTGTDLARIAECDAVRLLVRRATEQRPDLTLTSANARDFWTICRELDGMPLAIELAAARLNVLTPAELAERLAGNLRIVEAPDHDKPGGPPTRRSLRATLEWSYKILAAPERALFVALAVFSDGFDISAAERVCEDACLADRTVLDTLASLVRKNLLRREEASGRTRFRFLEIIRQYALSLFVLDPRSEKLRDDHAAYYLDSAETIAPLLHGPDSQKCIDMLDTDIANYEAAIACFRERGNASAALRLSTALEWFYFSKGRFKRGRDFIDAALASAGSDVPIDLRARAIRSRGWLAFTHGDWDAARADFERALRLFESIGDRVGISRSLSCLGVAERWMGSIDEGTAHCQEGIETARAGCDPECYLKALIWAYGTTSGNRHDDVALIGLREAVVLSEMLGDRWCSASAAQGLADLYRARGEYREAMKQYRKALDDFRALNDQWMIAWNLHGMATTSLLAGQREEACRFFRESIELFERAGDRRNALGSALHLAEHLAASREARTGDAS